MDSQRHITLNIGGTRYTTTLSTLLSAKQSYFTRMFRDTATLTLAEIFIDRDGELFKHILRFLRASPEGKVRFAQSLSASDKSALLDEVNFFQLKALKTLLLADPALRATLRTGTYEIKQLYLMWDSYNKTWHNNSQDAELSKLLQDGWDIAASHCSHHEWYILLKSAGS